MSELHPWVSTPEALQAARRAASACRAKLGPAADVVGLDELISEGYSILVECARPSPGRAEEHCVECQGLVTGRRRGAKYCSASCSARYRDRCVRKRKRGEHAPMAPARPKTHIGSMHSWPDGRMIQYATQEIALRLCHYASKHPRETPYGDGISLVAGTATQEAPVTPRDRIEAWLEDNGVWCDGTETVEELAEAVENVKGRAT